ncbi:MAG: hypothetical protein WBF17_10800, partial [Phycisphaerae bacterium]
MKTRYAIAIALLAGQLAGCSWVRKVWPWGSEDEVPVTRPTSEDANVPEPATPLSGTPAGGAR